MPDNSNENPNSLKSLFDRVNKGKLLDLENDFVETDETEMRAEINNIRNNRSGSSRNCKIDDEMSCPKSVSMTSEFLLNVAIEKIPCLKQHMQCN